MPPKMVEDGRSDLVAIPGTIRQTARGNLVQYCGDGELGKESRGENVAIPR